MATFTWSAAERVAACPASEALPAIFADSEYAQRGREIHRFMAMRIRGVPIDVALARTPPEYRDTCAGVRGSPGALLNPRAEVSYAVDVERLEVVELGQDIERHYPAVGRFVICGTLDVEGWSLDALPRVIDWKAGFVDVTPAEDNPQVMLEALALMLKHDAPEVHGAIGYVRPSGYIHFDRARFTRFDLESFSDRMYEACIRVEEAKRLAKRKRGLTVSTGPHCRYCPAKPACPAYTGLAKRILPELAAMRHELEAMTPMDQGRAWTKAKTILDLAGGIVEQLNEIADEAPFPTREGYEVRSVPYERADFDRRGAIALLRQLGATDEQIAALSTEKTTYQHREVKVRAGGARRLQA